jgi:osmotically-inducible protein OsmY
MKNILLLSLSIVPLLLSGCSAIGIAAGAGAATGIAAAQDGGIEGALTDTRIRATINDLWLKYDFKTFMKLELTVNEGRVLITGVVQDPEARVEAVRLAWQAKGVKEVINEIRVANSGGVTGYARDTWITTRLRTTLTFDREVQSINYSIDTVQGVVYLMGVARNQAELNRVMEIARTIPDVKQVVSYVRLHGEVYTPAPQNQNPNQNIGQPMQNAPAQNWQNQPQDLMPMDRQQGYSQGPAPLVPESVQSEQIH